MNILLDDLLNREGLFPFAQVRSVAHLRIGILTIFEKWQFFFPEKVFLASDKLTPDDRDFITYPANFVPSYEFLKKLCDQKSRISYSGDSKILSHPWEIFEWNDWAIRQDFEMITNGRSSQKISSSNQIISPENVFLEEGVSMEFAIINAEKGPVYIGKNAEIMEGSLLRGPISIGENSVLKMGTKIYGATTIGPSCLAGGEIKNSVLTGFSNKAHDGYLGDSVIGEWCNLGAGTSNSNLKNNASIVKIWSQRDKTYVAAGKKCGLLMGDYSRSAINTSFNTGTVAGVSCSIFGNTFQQKYFENFSWGNQKYMFEKAIEDIDNWKRLKGKEITRQEINNLKNIYS